MDPKFLLNPLILIPLLVWGLFWKGWALWVAAKRDDRRWFLVLLVFNTVGLLEFVYLFILGNRKSATTFRSRISLSSQTETDL